MPPVFARPCESGTIARSAVGSQPCFCRLLCQPCAGAGLQHLPGAGLQRLQALFKSVQPVAQALQLLHRVGSVGAAAAAAAIRGVGVVRRRVLAALRGVQSRQLMLQTTQGLPGFGIGFALGALQLQQRGSERVEIALGI